MDEVHEFRQCGCLSICCGVSSLVAAMGASHMVAAMGAFHTVTWPVGVQMRKAVGSGSAAKEAEKKKAVTGLDAMLAAIQGAKKVWVGCRPGFDPVLPVSTSWIAVYFANCTLP